MQKRLYLEDDFLGFVQKSKEQTGEQLGGEYAARVQTGMEKDGSPQYRYFSSLKEYEEYLSKQREAKTGTDGTKSKGSNQSMKERLQSKLKKEQSKSSKQAKDPASKKVSGSHSKNRSVFAGSTRSVKKFAVGKSLNLYLGDK
jgi:hypothetical protein